MKTAPIKPWPRWSLAFLLGMLLESVLCFFNGVLPDNSRLQEAFHGLFLWTHSPAYSLANALQLDLPGFFFLLVVMAIIWAFLFYLCFILASWATAHYLVDARRKQFAYWSLAVLIAATVVLTVTLQPDNSPRPFTASAELKSVVDGNTAFALDLYQKLKERPGNLFFSPYSISTALALAYAGARDGTEAGMARTLHFALPQEKLPAVLDQLVGRMEDVQRGNRLILTAASSLWGQKEHPFTGPFLDLIRTRYRAEARSVDFKSAAKETGDEITAWVKNHTQGKITGTGLASPFTPDTKVALCSAIYFNGQWETEFKKGETAPAQFFLAPDLAITVPMMRQHARLKITDVEGDEGFSCRLLEMPYAGKDLSMIVLLPNNPDGLAELEKRLTLENLRAWLARLGQHDLENSHAWLPRFKTTQSFDLGQELQSLGMTRAFGEGADFSGMDGTTNLYISTVIHQAFVEVNERGTEAAAVTVVHVRTMGMAPSFIADHPFLYLIRDNGSGSILFLGRMTDPTR